MDIANIMGEASRALDSATQFKQTIDRAKAEQEFIQAKVQARKFSHEFIQGLESVDDYTQYESLWSDKQQEIVNNISENLQTYDAKQGFQNWWMEQSEYNRQKIDEYAQNRKASSIRLDLTKTLQTAQTLPADEALDSAYDALENAVAHGAVTTNEAEELGTQFQSDIWFRDSREEIINTLYEDGYTTARKMILSDDLEVGEKTKQKLLDTLEEEWDKYDKHIRTQVDQAETQYIDLFADGGLRIEHILNDERLVVGHDYANQVKEKWIGKLQRANEAKSSGEKDPNEVNDPLTESEVYDLYIDPYVTPEEFKREVQNRIGADEDGNPMLSKKRGQYWIERADRKNVSGAFIEATDMINEVYDDLIDNTDDLSEKDKIRQKKLTTKKQLMEWISDSENKELLQNKDVILQQVAGNLLREKIAITIDPNYGYGDFKQKTFMDSMGLNDVERFTRMIHNGKLYGIAHDKYGGELLRYEEGLRKLGKDLFEKGFSTHREKGGHIPMFFPDPEGANGNYTMNYRGQQGVILEFFVENNDLVPKVYHPELDQWREIPQEMWMWLSPEKEEVFRTREEVKEKAEEQFGGRSIGTGGS